MSPQQLKSLLQKIESLPPDRQAQIARIVDELETQTRATSRLSDAQLAEVEDRLRNPSPRFLSLAEARARLLPAG